MRNVVKDKLSGRMIIPFNEAREKYLEFVLAPIQFFVLKMGFHNVGGRNRTSGLGLMSPSLYH